MFSWTNDSNYGLGSPQTPFHLGVYEPNEQIMGFNEFTDSISGNYSDSVTWIEYDGNGGVLFYEGQSRYIESNPQPGYYTLYAIVDTNASPDLEWGSNDAEVYVSGVLDTLIVFDFRLWSGRVFGTRYNVVVGEFLVPGPPCVPGTAPYFALDNLSDVPHGQTGYINASILDSCGNIVSNPPESYYRFELVGDTMTGVLYDPITWRTGAVLDSVSSLFILFDAWGKDPDSSTALTVTISAENGSISPASTSFSVLPSEVRVIAGKAMRGDTTVLSYGDTTSLTMQVREPGGAWMDQPDNWLPSWTIVQGDTFGLMYSLDSSQAGTLINGVPVVFYSANSEVAPDSTEVLIQLMSQEPPSTGDQGMGLLDPRNKVTKGQKTNTSRFTPSSIAKQQRIFSPLIGGGGGGVVHYGLARLLLKKSQILLGETKYYQARLVGDGPRIEEHSTPQSDGLTGVSFRVEKYSDPNNLRLGQRLGVYYEYKDSTGQNLDSTQQIRLVGRYWMQDSTYKVKLTGSYLGKSDSWIIEVKRPSKLGYTDSVASNIYGGIDNLDSLIIYYAGKYGVYPQMIKGVVKRESQFKPAYRYEPFVDIGYIQKKRHTPYLGNFRYRVNADGSVGRPDIPSDHQNVAPPSYYLGYVGTIWNFFSQHSSAINSNSNPDLYPRLKNIWAKKPFEGWNRIYRAALAKLKKTGKNHSEADLAAIDSAKDWLRYKYLGGVMDTAIAQTRTASSYGLGQVLYPTADLMGYPRGSDRHLPEYLNIADTIFQYAVPYTQKCLGDELRFEKVNGTNNWTLGIDSTYSLALSRYNGSGHNRRGRLASAATSGYGPDVRRKGLVYKIRK